MNQTSIMWKYIDEEPKVLSRLMNSSEIQTLAEEIGDTLDAVYFVAHGSSYNAAMAVSNFMASAVKLRVYVYTPANFQYNASSLDQEDKARTLIVTISQTGTSSGAIEALQLAHSLGFRTLGITDISGSPVAQIAHHVLHLGCGEEDSNAKTKGYSCTLLLLLLFCVQLARVRGTMDDTQVQAVVQELWEQIRLLPETKEKAIAWCRQHNFGSALNDLYVLGYGMNYGTAMEGQLKLMETMCIPTMFNDIGEFSHGMHRSITADSSLLLLRTAHPMADLMQKTFRYLCGITENVLMLDTVGDHSGSDHCLTVPGFPQTHSLLLLTEIIQVLSVFAPEQVGQDPNRNANDTFTTFVQTRVSP